MSPASPLEHPEAGAKPQGCREVGLGPVEEPRPPANPQCRPLGRAQAEPRCRGDPHPAPCCTPVWGWWYMGGSFAVRLPTLEGKAFAPCSAGNFRHHVYALLPRSVASTTQGAILVMLHLAKQHGSGKSGSAKGYLCAGTSLLGLQPTAANKHSILLQPEPACHSSWGVGV